MPSILLAKMPHYTINIQHLCPSLAIIPINIYWDATELFVVVMHSFLNRTPLQGTHWSGQYMLWQQYVPLINRLRDVNNHKVWYADDASAAGTLPRVT